MDENKTSISNPPQQIKKVPGKYVYPGIEKDGVRKLPSGAVYMRDAKGCLRRIKR